jgi:hypothetical protein
MIDRQGKKSATQIFGRKAIRMMWMVISIVLAGLLVLGGVCGC